MYLVFYCFWPRVNRAGPKRNYVPVQTFKTSGHYPYVIWSFFYIFQAFSIILWSLLKDKDIDLIYLTSTVGKVKRQVELDAKIGNYEGAEEGWASAKQDEKGSCVTKYVGIYFFSASFASASSNRIFFFVSVPKAILTVLQIINRIMSSM